MPKFTAKSVGNTGYVLISDAMDDGLGNVVPDIISVEQVEFGAFLKRCIAEGRKRVVFDIRYEAKR